MALFPLPRQCFEDIVAGCRMDLRLNRYADLRRSCASTASAWPRAVGLLAIEIFGHQSQGTREYAVLLGLALQLTNILRDVAEDAEKGRVYLPQDEMLRFSVTDDEVLAAGRPGFERSARLQALLAFQGERARAHFEQAKAALPEVDRRAMLPAEIMGAVYRACSRPWPRGPGRWGSPRSGAPGPAGP